MESEESFAVLRKRLGALPPGCQASVYGDGMAAVARAAARKARRDCPVGKGEPLTRRGFPRRRLKESIIVKTSGGTGTG